MWCCEVVRLGLVLGCGEGSLLRRQSRYRGGAAACPRGTGCVAGHADGSFNKSTAFNGWDKNLYSHCGFDGLPEFKAANAIDAGRSVIVWARLHINDIPITRTAEGRRYNPDFAVIEEVDGKRIGWLVETKSDKDIDSAEVAGKRRAARKWANTVNSSPDVDIEWKYLLLSEPDVADAQGSWEQMKGFGQ